MFGWRGRIGLIVASPNAVVEMEAVGMLPEGVSAHFTRVPYAGTGTPEAGRKMIENVENCAKLLAGSDETIRVDVIGLAHGSGSALSQGGAVMTLDEAISKAVGGVPAITASTAVLNALKKFGAKTVSIGLPLNQPSMIATVKNHLENNGITVRKVEYLNLTHHQIVSSQPPESAYRLMKQTFSNDVDAIVLNNSNLRTIEVIDLFEKDYGVPVITANQALMWACLRAIGIHDIVPAGRLFQF